MGRRALWPPIRAGQRQSDGEPIESQIAIIEQYVAGHPELKIVERYIDNGYTGTNLIVRTGSE